MAIAYGFHQLKDIFAERVTKIGEERVMTAIQQSVAEHNRQMDALFGLLVQPTDQFKIKYATPSAARLQPMDENGRARPIKPSGQYEIAFPLQMGAIAWGANFLSKAKMTVEEANRATVTLLSADFRWMRDHVLASFLTNTQWTFNDEQHGALVVKPMANGDTDLYLTQLGADEPVTDNHYYAQLAAIADGANPFPAIEEELTEHPENSGEVVNIIPTNLKASVSGLTAFHTLPDANVAKGLTADRLVGAFNLPVPGKVIGYLEDGGWVVEWKSMPSSYMISFVTGGERPIAMRQDPETELRGFQKVDERKDHPWWEAQYMRRAGFGGYNRVGAVVSYIGNAAYQNPAAYANPLP